jgi:hypothetical protein
MLGFRGHFATKSRSYSTTLGELRAAPSHPPRPTAGRPYDDSMAVLLRLAVPGSGYLNPGDVLLAAGVEASLRAAREAMLDLRRTPP